MQRFTRECVFERTRRTSHRPTIHVLSILPREARNIISTYGVAPLFPGHTVYQTVGLFSKQLPQVNSPLLTIHHSRCFTHHSFTPKRQKSLAADCSAMRGPKRKGRRKKRNKRKNIVFSVWSKFNLSAGTNFPLPQYMSADTVMWMLSAALCTHKHHNIIQAKWR